MSKVKKEDIYIISKHSNWSKEGIEKVLKNEIYSDKHSWNSFLRLFFISLGIGFTTIGILFFFAYNWADLHKFIKIGLIEALIIGIMAIVLFSKATPVIKNILLTGASMLVGVLFAVFGQIYQTGANAYDFFLGWSMAITLWVLISNFAPLWLLFIALINTTFILYIVQVAPDWSEIVVIIVLFLINITFLILTLLGKHLYHYKPPSWFIYLIGLTTLVYSTFGVCFIIFEISDAVIWDATLLIFTALSYALGIWYGLKDKKSFYLSVIPLSIIIIISAFLINLVDDGGMFFIITFFIIISITLVILNLVNLQKKWKK